MTSCNSSICTPLPLSRTSSDIPCPFSPFQGSGSFKIARTAGLISQEPGFNQASSISSSFGSCQRYTTSRVSLTMATASRFPRALTLRWRRALAAYSWTARGIEDPSRATKGAMLPAAAILTLFSAALLGFRPTFLVFWPHCSERVTPSHPLTRPHGSYGICDFERWPTNTQPLHPRMSGFSSFGIRYAKNWPIFVSDIPSIS